MSQSAMKACMCRNTARKYVKACKSPVELKKRHDWKTREDPFESVWGSEVVPMLERASELQAVTILEWLEAKDPQKFHSSLLRTLQRRVRQWRVKNGPDREVYFQQVREPGKSIQVDWTRMSKLEIRVAGEVYPHLLCHGVLPYSNWQWGMRCKSESFISIQNGLQQGLNRLGAVPTELWVDNSSAATCQLPWEEGKARRFNDSFQGLCDHFGLQPRAIQVNSPNENGDVESSHGHLKRRIHQQLLLRGNRDFERLEDYDQFLADLFEKINKPLMEKVKEETDRMRPLPTTALPDYREYECVVSCYSTIQLQKATYSVPSRLIGTRLRAWVWEDRIKLFFGREEVADLSRRHWTDGAFIDYRHVIGHLIRKPGAFADYRWRESMFPTPVFKAAYEEMERQSGTKLATREYLQILKLAAEGCQKSVETALEDLLGNPKERILSDEVKNRLGCYEALALKIQSQPAPCVDLSVYDRMLESEVPLEF